MRRSCASWAILTVLVLGAVVQADEENRLSLDGRVEYGI